MKNMKDIDRQIVEKVMEWISPKYLPEGNYHSVHENEEFGIGPVIGYRHTKTDTFYTLKEWEKYEYWTTKDGEIAKAPWGGLVHKNNFYKWIPSTNIAQAMYIVNMLQKKGFHVQIQDGSDFKTFCTTFQNFEFGFETTSEAITLELSICLAALKVMNWEK